MKKKPNVFITGAAKGLGKQLTLTFVKQGHRVVIHDFNKKLLGDVESKIKSLQNEYSIVTGDLSKRKTITKIYDSIRNEKIKVLINNAGSLCPYLPLHEIRDEQIVQMLSVNLIAQILLIKKAVCYFRINKNCTIININSLSGLQFHRFRTIYSASKWGLRGFSECLKQETDRSKIRIIDIFPSRIRTQPEYSKGMSPQEVAEKIYSNYAYTENDSLIIDGR